MRSAFAIVAFAASAIAVPYTENKRSLMAHGPPPPEYGAPAAAPVYDSVELDNPDVEVEIEVETEVVWVTAYGPAPTEPAKAPHYGHKNPPAPVSTAPPPPPVYEPVEPAPVETAPVENAPVYSAPSSGGSGDDVYQSSVVDSHNKAREHHGCSQLTWNQELADYAEQAAKKCRYEHRVDIGGGGYGQNIAAGVAKGEITKVIYEMFYEQEAAIYEPYYGQEPPDSIFEAVGHMTQIVWAATTEVGCYTTTDDDCSELELAPGINHFTVCNYKTPGNYGGQFAVNVPRPTS